MKKKIRFFHLSFFVLTMLVFTSQSAYAAAPIELSIGAPTAVDAGEAFEVSVSIPEGSRGATCSFNILYDSDMFFCTDYTCGLLPDNTTSVNLTYDIGKIRVSSIIPDEITRGGTLITLHFRAKPSASSSGYISLDQIKMANVSGVLLESNTYTTTNVMVNKYIAIPVEIISPSSVFQYEDNSISISIGAAKDVFGGEIKIDYDSSAITSVSVEASSALNDCMIQKNITDSSVSLGWMGTDSLVAGDEIFQISFVVKKSQVDTAMQIARVLLVDEYGNTVPHTLATKDVKFTVEQCSPAVLAESITSSSATLRISGTANGYAIVSFYKSNGQMVASTIKATSHQDTTVTLSSTADLTQCTWKVIYVNSKFLPICNFSSSAL